MCVYIYIYVHTHTFLKVPKMYPTGWRQGCFLNVFSSTRHGGFTSGKRMGKLPFEGMGKLTF